MENSESRFFFKRLKICNKDFINFFGNFTVVKFSALNMKARLNHPNFAIYSWGSLFSDSYNYVHILLFC